MSDYVPKFNLRERKDDNSLISLIERKLRHRNRLKSKNADHFRINETDITVGNSFLKVLKELKVFNMKMHAKTHKESYSKKERLLSTIIGIIENRNKGGTKNVPKLVTMKAMQSSIMSMYSEMLQYVDDKTINIVRRQEFIEDIAILENIDSFLLKEFGVHLYENRKECEADVLEKIKYPMKERMKLIIGKLLEINEEGITEITADEVVNIYLSSVPSIISRELLITVALEALASFE